MSIFFKPFAYTLLRRFDHSARRVEWNMTTGDFKYIRGYWQLQATPAAGRYLLIYENYVDPGFYVPTWIMKLVQKEETKKMARAIRGQLEARRGR